MQFSENVVLEMIKGGVSLTLLFFTWLFGQRILVSWDMRKKRQELDIATANEFHHLYGEFKAVTKLWRVMKRIKTTTITAVTPVPTARWDLLSRACAAESKNESIIVKLATERPLEEKEIRTLGLFRQAFQQLREAIRDDKVVRSSSRGPEYVFFNVLACEASFAIAKRYSMKPLASEVAVKNLHAIVNIRSPDYKTELTKFVAEHNESFSEDELKAWNASFEQLVGQRS